MVGIESNPFGGVKLTGEDATAFREQFLAPGEYPVEPMEGVDPKFVAVMMREQMAALYQQAVPDLSDSEAMDAALATWDTDWPDDPEPRTFAAMREVVSDDLAYGNED